MSLCLVYTRCWRARRINQQDKANSFSSIKPQSVDDALLNGFERGSATFINYERVVGKKSKAMLTDNERDNLVDKIGKSFSRGPSLYRDY